MKLSISFIIAIMGFVISPATIAETKLDIDSSANYLLLSDDNLIYINDEDYIHAGYSCVRHCERDSRRCSRRCERRYYEGYRYERCARNCRREARYCRRDCRRYDYRR